MNIGKISNAQFRGAYYIKGKGADVKQTEDLIKSNYKDRLKVAQIGSGYLTNDTPTSILVTTRYDVDVYDYLDRWEKECCNDIAEQYPNSLKREDFENLQDFLKYKIAYDDFVNIKAIEDNCEFIENPKTLEAEDVLDAIKHDRFDFEYGEIEELKEKTEE